MRLDTRYDDEDENGDGDSSDMGGGGVWKLPSSAFSERSEAPAPTKTERKTARYKDVVIIGNGPSAICLSYMLAGNVPFYGDAVHPVDFLHKRLQSERSVSLFYQNLRVLSEGLEGRSTNPVSVLFDMLAHAQADFGLELPSFLRWERRRDHVIDHVVLGRGQPGGSWQFMEPNSLTLSLSHWMELPGLGYKDWERKTFRNCRSRALVGDVAAYFADYVKLEQLDKYFRNHSHVTSVTRNDDLWEVEGRRQGGGGHFRYVTPSVVLATGVGDRPNQLNVRGESLPFVHHTVSHLNRALNGSETTEPVLIVGAGLTAADAVITAGLRGVPVVHVFRRAANDPRLVFARLPEHTYPEYHRVHKLMMKGGECEPTGSQGYRSYSKHEVVEFLAGRKVRIQGPDSSFVLKVRSALVLIGSKPDLSFVEPELGSKLVVVDAFSHESVHRKGLYAIGPLVGDNFVRFLQGGALAVASHLHQQRRLLALTSLSCNIGAASVTSAEVVSEAPSRLQQQRWLWLQKLKRRRRRFSHPVCDSLNDERR